MAFASTRARRLSRAGVAVVSVALLGAVFAANGALAQTKPTANAQIKDAAGRVVATADLREGAGEVIIQLSLPNPPVVSGVKGFHIREHGRCDGPDFSSAGDIFNPTNRQHGLQNPQGPMVGDLPNVLFAASGLTSYNTSSVGASLSTGAGNLMDADGSALVIMSDIDDGKTQPEGNSGQRLACGVLAAGPAAAAPIPAVANQAAALPTPTPRPTLAVPVAPVVPAKPGAAPTATAPAKPVATIPARPTQSATLTAFALSVAKPGAPGAAAKPGAVVTPTPAPGAALAKPSIVIPATGAQQLPPLTAAQQPTTTQSTNSGGGPPPAFLIAALGIILLGAGYAVGRFRTKP